jgi:hypothetical protein
VTCNTLFFFHSNIFNFLGFTHFRSLWSIWYLIPCTLCIYLIILVMLCYWHYSICYILFNREALLRDNTIITRYRRQVARLLIALIVSFFVLILPYKIWALIQPQLSIKQFLQLGFRRHSLLIITTRSLLYLNSAVSLIEILYKYPYLDGIKKYNDSRVCKKALRM